MTESGSQNKVNSYKLGCTRHKALLEAFLQ